MALIDLADWRRRLMAEIATTNGAINQLTQRHDDIEIQLKGESAYLAELQAEIEIMEQAGESYKGRLLLKKRRGSLSGNCLWETLIIHFASDEGLIIGRDAVATLLEVGYFTNKRQAEASVYTNLRKPIFTKVRPGVYQVGTETEDWGRLRHARKAQEARNGG